MSRSDPPPGAARLPDRTANFAREFLSALFMSLRTAQIHDPGNRAYQTALTRLQQSAEALYAASGGFEVRVVDEFFFINGARLPFDPGSSETLRTLRNLLEAQSLGGFSIESSPTAQGLLQLLSMIAGQQPITEGDQQEELRRLKIGVLGPQRMVDGTAAKIDRGAVAVHTYAKLILAVRDRLRQLEPGSTAPSELQGEIRAVRIVQDLVELVSERIDLLLRLATNTHGAALEELHGANCCVLSIALGYSFGFHRRELSDLGMAALFHHIGQFIVGPDHREHHAGLFEAASLAHTLAESGIGRSLFTRAMILSEQQGPTGTAPRKAHPFSRVLRVAATYSRQVLGYERTEPPAAPIDALSSMRRDTSGWLDPACVDLLINLLRAYPPGTQVVLESGHHAVVATPLNWRWDRPQVRVASRPPKTVDLLVEVDGRFTDQIVGTQMFLGAQPAQGQATIAPALESEPQQPSPAPANPPLAHSAPPVEIRPPHTAASPSSRRPSIDDLAMAVPPSARQPSPHLPSPLGLSEPAPLPPQPPLPHLDAPLDTAGPTDDLAQPRPPLPHLDAPLDAAGPTEDLNHPPLLGSHRATNLGPTAQTIDLETPAPLPSFPPPPKHDPGAQTAPPPSHLAETAPPPNHLAETAPHGSAPALPSLDNFDVPLHPAQPSPEPSAQPNTHLAPLTAPFPIPTVPPGEKASSKPSRLSSDREVTATQPDAQTRAPLRRNPPKSPNIARLEEPKPIQPESDGGQVIHFGRPRPDRLIGSFLAGKYRVLEKIGEGGMGTVFLASQEPIDRQVAVKVLHHSLTNDDIAVRRFQREARVISRMRHPNTVTVYDFGQTQAGELYLVMEFLEGQTVAQLLRSAGPLDGLRASNIIRQTCGSLAEAHELGIIHRDLKPDNIFLTRYGDHKDFVKVLDFGLVKLADNESMHQLTQQGKVYGTPRYMAPEQAEGKPIDPRSDIYTLGVVLYELLVGRPLFTAETMVALLVKHIQTPPPPMAAVRPDLNIDPRLESIVMWTLAKKANDRPQTVMELARELERWEQDAQASFATPFSGQSPMPAGLQWPGPLPDADPFDQSLNSLLNEYVSELTPFEEFNAEPLRALDSDDDNDDK